LPVGARGQGGVARGWPSWLAKWWPDRRNYPRPVLRWIEAVPTKFTATRRKGNDDGLVDFPNISPNTGTLPHRPVGIQSKNDRM
jgi:hypothetical protein